MKQLKEQIRKESKYNSYDKETLVDMLIVARQDLRIEKTLSEWLDTLADALRDEDDTELMDEAEALFGRYKETQKEIQKTRI
jgi:hypothetical protein